MGRFLLFVLMLVFAASGAVGIYMGAAYDSPYAKKVKGFVVPDEVAKEMEKLKRAYLDSDYYRLEGDPIEYGERGFFKPFTYSGDVLLLLSLLCLMLFIFGGGEKRRPARAAAKPAEKKIPRPKPSSGGSGGSGGASSGAGAAAPAAPPPGAAKAVMDTFDLDKLIGGDDKKDGQTESEAMLKKLNLVVPDELMDSDVAIDPMMFYDIDAMVSLEQSHMSDKQFNLVLSILRPEFKPFVGMLNEDARHNMGRQITRYHVLRLKRSEKGISPDQFIAQDKRMAEAERETVIRRYMPAKTDNLDAETKALVGKVFTLVEQYKLQQETLSEAEDWVDISLRNFVSVMGQPAPGA